VTKSLWWESRIAELGRVVTGTTPPSSRPECFADGDGYPFITPADMWAGRKVDEPARLLSEKGAALLRTRLLPPGSVAVSCIGWQMGRAVMTSRPSFTNQQLNAIVPNATVDSEFLYYSLCTRQEELLSLGSATGVRTPIINKSAFGNLTLLIPPLEVQRRIASILSAYDDLIENNLRRIKILEEMAQSMYEEWFVDFRFPGHENVNMVDSPQGLIPEGWAATSVGNVCHIVMGQSPPSEFYNTAGEGLPFHQGVTDFGEYFPRPRVFCNGPSRVAAAGDILVSVRAPVGRLNLAQTKIAIGRGLGALHNNQGLQAFTLYQLKVLFVEEDRFGGGTIFKSVTRGDVESLPFVLPPRQLAEEFERIASEIIELMENCDSRVTRLRQCRDVLLPKLISGELDVSDLDIDVGEDAA
jgi:type I restriction enzyme S subunit